MKQLLCVAFFALCATHIYAQDVIVKKDGSTILSKVLEVNTSDIKYKKSSNLNGPTYTINMSEIMTINYENGEKEDFNNINVTTTQSLNNASSQGYIQKLADSRNAELIDFYNNVYQPTSLIKRKDKIAKGAFVIFGIKTSSIVSNEEIEIKFKKQFPGKNVFNLIITNKTDRTIYIDKGTCFMQQDDEDVICYYENTEQTTVSHGGNSGVSIGLGNVAGVLGIGGKIGQLAGGIGIGEGTSNNTSTTYLQQRIIAIPPHGQKSLSEEKKVQIKKGTIFNSSKYKRIDSAEHFTWGEVEEFLPFVLKKGIISQGDVKTFEENELPWKRSYYLTYSTEEDFRTYSTLHFELYIHEVIGEKDAWYSSNPIFGDLEDYIEGATDNSLIVGGDFYE